MRTAIKIVSLGLLTFCVIHCSARSDRTASTSDEQVASRSDKLTAEQTCSVSSLDWALNPEKPEDRRTCDGVWSVLLYNRCREETAACQAPANPDAPSDHDPPCQAASTCSGGTPTNFEKTRCRQHCRDPYFGVEAPRVVERVPFTVTVRSDLTYDYVDLNNVRPPNQSCESKIGVAPKNRLEKSLSREDLITALGPFAVLNPERVSMSDETDLAGTPRQWTIDLSHEWLQDGVYDHEVRFPSAMDNAWFTDAANTQHPRMYATCREGVAGEGIEVTSETFTYQDCRANAACNKLYSVNNADITQIFLNAQADGCVNPTFPHPATVTVKTTKYTNCYVEASIPKWNMKSEPPCAAEPETIGGQPNPANGICDDATRPICNVEKVNEQGFPACGVTPRYATCGIQASTREEAIAAATAWSMVNRYDGVVDDKRDISHAGKSAFCSTCDSLSLKEDPLLSDDARKADFSAKTRAKMACLLSSLEQLRDTSVGCGELPAATPPPFTGPRLPPFGGRGGAPGAGGAAGSGGRPTHGSTGGPPAPPPPTNVSSSQEAVIRKIKLLFELQAEKLTTEQQTAALNLYATAPSVVESQCVVPMTFPTNSSDSDCPSQTELQGRLQACRALASKHASEQAASAFADLCLSAAEDVLTKVPQDCGRNAIWTSYKPVAIGQMRKALLNGDAKVGPGGALDRVTWLQQKLALFEKWYKMSINNVARGSAEEKQVWGDASDLLGEFWKSVYGTDDAAFGNGTDATIEKVNQLFTSNLGHDEEALRAAFTKNNNGTLSLSSAPLAMVLGDGLKGMVDRLDIVAEFHDFACEIKGCPAGLAQASEYTLLWNLLASLDDAGKLTTLLVDPRTSGLSLSHPEWINTFKLIRDNHTVLQTLVKDLTGSTTYAPVLLGGATPENTPAPLVLLSSLIQKAKARVISYNKLASLEPVKRNHLYSGIQSKNLEDISRLVQTRQTELAQSIDRYGVQIKDIAKDAVTEIREENNRKSVANQILRKLLDSQNTLNDIAGLRLTMAEDDARFASFATDFAPIAENVKVAGDQLIERRIAPFTVNASDARYTGSIASIADFAVNGATMMNVPAGRVLTISADGRWSPTCSMQRVGGNVLPKGNGMNTGSIDVTGAITGPEGFTLDVVGSTYKAASVQSADSTRSSQTLTSANSVCAGLKYSAGGDFVKAFGFDVYVDLQSCLKGDFGIGTSQEQTHQHSDGTESRIAGSFSRGLRLRNTPFSSLPVGGLIMAVMPKGEQGPLSVIDAHVLNSTQTTVVIPHDADVYFVVNDEGGCTNVSGSIGLNVTQSVPAAAIMDKFEKAVPSVLSVLRTRTKSLVAQGRLLPSDSAALHTQATEELVKQMGVGLGSLPESLRDFWNAWLTREVLRVERHAEIAGLERLYQNQLLDARVLYDDLDNNQDLGRFLSQLARWNLRLLPEGTLQVQIRDLMRLVNRYLTPAMRIRYQNVLDSLNPPGRTDTAFDALIHADWQSSFLELATKTSIAIKQTTDALALPTAEPTTIPLYISFPRTINAGTPENPDPQFASPPSAQFNSVSLARAHAVWRQILAKRPVTLQVEPNDVYAGSPRGLGPICSNAPAQAAIAPVINYMGVYLVTNQSTDNLPFNFPTRTVSMAVDQQLTFAMGSGPQTFTLAAPDAAPGHPPSPWLSGNPRIVAGTIGDLENLLTRYITPRTGADAVTAVGTGLSPVTSYTLNLDPVHNFANVRYFPDALPTNGSTYARELVIVMKVEASSILANPLQTWVPACAPAP